MKKKLSKILIAVMIAVMVIPTVNYSFAETASQQGAGIESQEPDKATTGSDAVTPEDGTEEEPTDSSQKSEKEVVGNGEVSEEPSTGDSTKGSGEAVAENVTEEMKFLYIDNRELAAPGTQNIVVSWDSSLDEIEEMQLIYEGPSGEKLSLKEANRTDSSVLFTKNFKASEQGNYTIKGVKYFINDEEQYFEFDNVEIDATFAVTAPEESEENVVDIEVNENGTINKKEISNDIDAALATASISAPLKASRSAKSGNVVVVLDPGHGGGDPGAVANGLYEKNLTLKIAQYCKAELEQYSGIEVYMTRDRDSDVGGSTATQELQNRVNVGKKYGADLLISIHINAGGGTGAEVYYPNNNYNSSIGSQGGSAATKIQAELTALGLYNRGTKIRNAVNDKYPNGSAADYYGIIRMSKLAGFPGLIVEHAFIDNKNDAAFLKSEANLKKLGVADATGIAKYFGLSKGAWEQDSKGWKYKNADGSYKKSEFATIGSYTYYFDRDGYRVTGKIEVNGNQYYFDKEGKAKAGWITVNGKKYYSRSDGSLYRGLNYVGADRYYFDPNTREMKTGKIEINGNQYYFDKEGKAKAGWITVNGKKYYSRSDGSLYRGLNYVGADRYYFDPNTREMKTGKIEINGNQYYFDKEGKAKAGWITVNGKKYYSRSDGSLYRGLNYVGADRYYFDPNTREMKTGKIEINGNQYYFDKEGKAKAGWITVNGKKYYSRSDGSLYRGLNYVGADRYYFDPNTREMKTGEVVIDGITYNFGTDGKLVQNTKISGTSQTSVRQMVEYYKNARKKYPSSAYRAKGAADIETFCEIYYEEAESEGIRAEVAFCQAMKETGWLQFGGDVKVSQCNFAGLGATGGGASGATFKDVRTGIRAHIQHLKAYANDEPLNNELVDPRFRYVDRGCAPYVEWLGQKENPDGKGWATAKGYGQSIVSMIENLLAI